MSEPTFKQRARELLNQETVAAIEAPEKVIIIDSKESLHDAFQVLFPRSPWLLPDLIFSFRNC